jgi:glutamate formiminotransferase / 5-formyltetrahydrofolate cyclo-ligase
VSTPGCIECVVNVSEGRDHRILAELAQAAGPCLRDLHADPDHHRAVLTLAGPPEQVVEAAQSLATATVDRLDLGAHQGAHPRLGVLDVVPFVPYDPGRTPPADLRPVLPLRDEFARWLATTLGVPAFLYGPLPDGTSRSLPDVRRHAFTSLTPDLGPPQPHPTAGASAVGARPALVAYNVWVSSVDLARQVAPQVRGPYVRALGLDVGDRAQVSCNLIDPARMGPAQLFDLVSARAMALGGAVAGAELVGLLPESALEAIPPDRWAELGLQAGSTVEARLRTLG